MNPSNDNGPFAIRTWWKAQDHTKNILISALIATFIVFVVEVKALSKDVRETAVVALQVQRAESEREVRYISSALMGVPENSPLHVSLTADKKRVEADISNITSKIRAKMRGIK